MTNNPLQDDPAREHRIRERAYHLWDADGRPHGRDVEYWERARELVGMEESAGAGELPNPEAHPPLNEVAPGVQAEEAAIQENLGEFPDRLTDQGEQPQTPAARRAPRKRAAQPDKPPTPAGKPARKGTPASKVT